jgi:cell division GTPase FtsZ
MEGGEVMKLAVIGLGQCGGRIADEFARLALKARDLRGLDILAGAFAVNSDAADLAGIVTIKPDHHRRILIGAEITHGHGVAKVIETGTEIAIKDGARVIDALHHYPGVDETDAFLLVTATGGGTGAGATPVLVSMLQEHFSNIPVYVMTVLPFEHEQNNEERAVYNTAVCLKALSEVSRAVILVDNQRYVGKDNPVENNIRQINKLIVDPFFDLLCAGEEKRLPKIAARALDTEDIIQTLGGWTAIGYGQILKPLITMPSDESPHFIKRESRMSEGVQSIDQAMAQLSIGIKPSDAHRAFLLISAPAKDLSMNLIQDLGAYLHLICPQAAIKIGDYPREKGMLDVTLILSELGDVEKVNWIYARSSKLKRDNESRRIEREAKLEQASEDSKDIPTLL